MSRVDFASMVDEDLSARSAPTPAKGTVSMDQLPLVPMDMPATYRICVTGCLESDLAERLWGMTSSPIETNGKPEQTVLVGEVADQAALVGIINALYNSGHTVVLVERLPRDADPHMDDSTDAG